MLTRGRTTRLTLLLLLLATACSRAQTVSDYNLDVTFHPQDARMEGVATVLFDSPLQPGSVPAFYLHGELSVDSATSGSELTTVSQEQVFYSFEYSLIATKAAIELTAPTNAMTIYYSGHFNPSKARSPSDYMRIDADGVLLRSYGYSLWFPVFLEAGQDDPTVNFSDVTIRTPKDYRSVFAGHQLSDAVDGDWRVTRWAANGYRLRAVQCTAQKYQVTSSGDFHLYHYADSQSVTVSSSILDLTQFLTGAFAKAYRSSASTAEYYVIEMPRYGDISSANVTGLTYWTWQGFADDEHAQRALAHELVHPFVGVPVERADSIYTFAVEGFPSYFHLPVLAQRLGAEFYDSFMDWMQGHYLKKRETGLGWRDRPLPPAKPILSIRADEMSTYKDTYILDDRAVLFLDYLYRKMGANAFFAWTSDMCSQKTLTTTVFRDLIEKHYPNSARVVKTWLETNDYPKEFQRN